MTAASGRPARTASQIGRASQSRGKETERLVARAARPWWPGSRRARDNGSRFTADQGDLAGMADAAVFWSVKGDRTSHQRGKTRAWMAEMTEKGGGRMGVLVERCDGIGDPLTWWAWAWLGDLVSLALGAHSEVHTVTARTPARVELGHLFGLFERAGWTDLTPAELRARPRLAPAEPPPTRPRDLFTDLDTLETP